MKQASLAKAARSAAKTPSYGAAGLVKSKVSYIPRLGSAAIAALGFWTFDLGSLSFERVPNIPKAKAADVTISGFGTIMGSAGNSTNTNIVIDDSDGDLDDPYPAGEIWVATSHEGQDFILRNEFDIIIDAKAQTQSGTAFAKIMLNAGDFYDDDQEAFTPKQAVVGLTNQWGSVTIGTHDGTDDIDKSYFAGAFSLPGMVGYNGSETSNNYKLVTDSDNNNKITYTSPRKNGFWLTTSFSPKGEAADYDAAQSGFDLTIGGDPNLLDQNDLFDAINVTLETRNIKSFSLNYEGEINDLHYGLTGSYANGNSVGSKHITTVIAIEDNGVVAEDIALHPGRAANEDGLEYDINALSVSAMFGYGNSKVGLYFGTDRIQQNYEDTAYSLALSHVIGDVSLLGQFVHNRRKYDDALGGPYGDDNEYQYAIGISYNLGGGATAFMSYLHEDKESGAHQDIGAYNNSFGSAGLSVSF